MAVVLGFLFREPLAGVFLPNHKTDETEDKTIIMVVETRPKTLDPRRAQDVLGMRMSDLIYQSLVAIGPKFKPVGDLAERWTVKDNVYTFYLRPDIIFSNGQPLRKKDILYSFEEFMSKNSPFSSSFKIIKKVEVLLDRNRKQKLTDKDLSSGWIVKVYLKAISAKFLSADLPVLKIMSFPDTPSDPPVGSGPFVLQDYGINHIALSPNPYFLKPESMEEKVLHTSSRSKVIFQIVRDELTRYQKLLNQEVDIMISALSPAKLDIFLKKSQDLGYKIYKGPVNTVSYILLNLKDSCLLKRDFRSVLGFSLNRPAIIKYKMFGLAREAVSLLPPHHFFFNSHLTAFSYDKSRAYKLLNSVSQCKNRELTLKCSASSSSVGLCKVFVSDWRAIGLSVKLEHLEWARFYDDLNQGHFQIAYHKWVGVSDPDIYRLAFHSREIPPEGRNRSFYRNTALDLKLEQAMKTMDVEKRKQLYGDVQAVIMEEKVILPLWYETPVAIVGQNIANFKLADHGGLRFLLDVEKITFKR